MFEIIKIHSIGPQYLLPKLSNQTGSGNMIEEHVSWLPPLGTRAFSEKKHSSMQSIKVSSYVKLLEQRSNLKMKSWSLHVAINKKITSSLLTENYIWQLICKDGWMTQDKTIKYLSYNSIQNTKNHRYIEQNNQIELHRQIHSSSSSGSRDM